MSIDTNRESEIDAFIASLSPLELRRIVAVLEYGEHKCSGPRIGCCGSFRCEPCHVNHLRHTHGEHSAMFWNKLCQESRITWKENTSSLPVPKSALRRKKVSKNDPIRYQPVNIEEELQQALDFMNKLIKIRANSL